MTNKQIRVLICDDSLLVRKQLKDLLIALNCTVVEAANGEEAVTQYKAHSPQLVFMDIVMPVMDGVQSLARIKAHDANAHMVVLTSTGTANRLREALKAGAVDFIQKPYTKDQIERILNTLQA